MAVQIQLRHDTSANWTASNPVLAVGEMGVETNTLNVKIGDGATAWNSLAYGLTAATVPAHAATHVSTGSDPIANAIAAGASGLMSGADKTKLNGVSGSNTGDETAATIESKLAVSAGNVTALASLSGTNTGDETLSTIKTKLGITTLSGANTGDQTISCTGDVTATGSTGALATTVTKLNGTLLSGLGTGLLKNTTGTGVPSIAVSGDLPGGPYIPTSTTHLSGDVATTTTVNGHALSSNVTVTASDVSLGSVTNAAQTLASIVPNTVPAAGNLLVGNAGGTAYASVAASGDVFVSSTGAHTIQPAAVTLAKQANLAANSIQGNNTVSPAAPIALTVAQTQALLLVQPRGFTTTAMAGTTTTLTNASTRLQMFTGSGATNQTVVLPDATTLPFVDTEYEIDNNTSGTGTITLQANGGATLYIFGPGAGGRVDLMTKSVAAGTWDVDAYNPNPASGKVLNVSNSLTLAGTDGTTITFPGSSTNVPQAAQTITFSGPTAARTVTLPDSNTTVPAATQQLTFSGPTAARTITLPDSATTVPTITQALTISGPTAARTITVPDANFTVARTDAANTFTGVQTMTSPAFTTPAIGAATGTSLTVTGAILSSGGGHGYSTGAGGTVTQGTSRTTGVTLSKLCGQITLFTTTLAAVTSQAFVVTNTFVAATDMVVVQHASGGTLGLYTIAVTPASGSFTVTIRNNSASASASEAPVLQFVVIKAVTS